MTEEVLSDTRPTDYMDSRQNQERLLGQLGGAEITDEERTALHQRFAGLVEVVASWATSHEHQVDTIRPLGGGFQNPYYS